MRVCSYVWVLPVLLLCTSCSSYEEQRKVEIALTESLNRFHEQLNNERYGEIYAQADPRLRARIDEATFTAQLRNAHDQMGTLSRPSKVLLSSRAWNDLEWSRILGREQRVIDADSPNSDLINATERFEWIIENDEPKLAWYEFRFICKKPCTVGIGIP